ncbi:hypothetical protein EDC04DRAFT_2732249 [Pisolithus marmoratus]|nr:hypothetical protein EDC04DRAFT_2732249 [Pisolithus marmoratus]
MAGLASYLHFGSPSAFGLTALLQSIVRKLIKVVKDCKEPHTRRRRASVSARRSITTTPKPRPTHLLGEKSAEAISKDQDDSDFDLDFVPDIRVSVYLGNGKSGNAFSFSAAGALAAEYSPAELREHIASVTEVHAALNSPPFTASRGALSLAFVKTIGRLGRWKRVLNSRRTIDVGIAVPANVSAFDLEMSATNDLLTVWGGVEQYLKMIELHPPRTPVHPNVDLKIPQEPAATVEVAEEEEGTGSAAMVNRVVSMAESQSQSSIVTRSTESFCSVLTSELKVNPVVTQVQARPPWRFDVVSIDDPDLSDSLSEAHIESPSVPPGLRKAPRKSGQSVSSMGIRSRDSVASEKTNIQQWQVNAIVDSLTDDGGTVAPKKLCGDSRVK